MDFKETVVKQQGRAIARGIAEEQARKKVYEAGAVKRKAIMLEKAAMKALTGKL